MEGTVLGSCTVVGVCIGGVQLPCPIERGLILLISDQS